MYYEVERDKKFLKDIGSDEIETLRFKDGHRDFVADFKFIDNETCVSVSHDGSIALWNVAHSDSNCFTRYPNAHDRAIVCVDVFDDKKFCTGSFDNTLKLWSPEQLCPISTHYCALGICTISCENFLIAAGMTQNTLLLHDIRQNSSKTVTPEFNIKKSCFSAISKVTLDDHCVYVTHRDGTISCFDLRTERILKSVDTSALMVRPRETYLNVCGYYKGNLVVELHDEVDHTIFILDKNLEELSRNTITMDDSVDGFACIKINESNVFVGARRTVHCLLKSDPIVPLVKIAIDNGVHSHLSAIEYISDRALLWGFFKGEVIIHKRVNSNVNI